MITRSEMLAEAEQAGYGAQSGLGATFNNWRGYGLIGKASTKAPRRGGEGLWHPIQLQLLLAMLRLRREGASLASLANLPVGIWLMAWPGIETVQAQRALYFWMRGTSKTGERPRGKGSVRLRVIQQEIDRLADPDASLAARRRLRESLSHLTEGIAATWATPPEGFVRDVLAVMSPHDPESSAAKAKAASLFMGIRHQLFAVDGHTATTPARRGAVLGVGQALRPGPTSRGRGSDSHPHSSAAGFVDDGRDHDGAADIRFRVRMAVGGSGDRAPHSGRGRVDA